MKTPLSFRITILTVSACLLLFGMLPSGASAAVFADFKQLVKAASPAVVNISTERTVQKRQLGPGFRFFRGHPDLDRFFEDFEQFEEFGMRGPSSKRTSLGSGFLISADGYIVTNHHVVENADKIRVTFDSSKNKEKEYSAEVIGADPETDLALLKINATGLPFLEFGNSDVLEVGEWLLAIGNPLGLDHTVTAGILSAKNRNIQSGSYDDYLQTDASINPGNSGGPLLNMDGKVIGINTAIAQRAQGIGFAIPSSMAQVIIESLKAHRKVSRGWLGVGIQNVDEATAKALDMKSTKGVLIRNVEPGQPADKAGIKSGDVIIAVGDTVIEDSDQLLRKVALLAPGSQAKITVWRDGKELVVTLTVAERETKTAAATSSQKEVVTAKLGITVRAVSAEDQKRNNLQKLTGVTVADVSPDSVAAKVGIRPGDVIVSVNRREIKNIDDLNAQITEGTKKHGALLLHVIRDGNWFFCAFDLAE